MNAYSCNCAGYSGFLDTLKDIFQVAIPVTTTIQGAQSGGLEGAITGLTKGIQTVTPQVTPTYIYSPTGVPMLVSGQGSTDSLLGAPQQQLTTYYNNAANAFQPPTYVYTQPPAPAPTNTLFGMDEKTVLAVGLGAVALIGLIFLTRR